jgi:hypothetical protein
MEACQLTKVTPKGCTPRRRPPAELTLIPIPGRVVGVLTYRSTLVQTRLKQQIHRASTHSFLLLSHLPDFSALPHMSIASPLPHPATPLLTGLAVLSSSWPLWAGPAGRLTPLRATGPAAPRPGSRWSRRLLSPFSSATPSSLCSCHRARLHTHGPPARSLRITSPSGVMPGRGSAVTWRISGHVPSLTPGGHGPTLPHVPWVTSPFSPHVPWSRPPSHSQSEPMHTMHCSDWGALLMGASYVAHYFTPSVALARALGPPASSPAVAAVEE